MRTRTQLALTGLFALAAACGDDSRNAAAGLVAPQVKEMARYLDVNLNGIIDAGDQVVVPFDTEIKVSPGADGTAFRLGVAGDSLGAGATVTHGPAPADATITLGVGPILRISGRFATNAITPGSPSGIDVAGDVNDMIEEDDTDIDADRTEQIDIVPGLVQSPQVLGPGPSFAVATGDVDGDLDLDLVFGTGSGAELWLNDNNGNFTKSVQTFGTGTVQSVVLADLDGLFGLDIALGLAAGGNRVYLNTAVPGVFTGTGQDLGTDNTYDLVAADVDDDLDLDLVAANGTGVGGDASNRIWLNNGLGSFADSLVILGGGDTRAILAFDIDGDTDIDIVELNFNQPDLVWKGDGAGDFTSSGQIALSLSRANAAAVADVDNDLDLDFVEGNGDLLTPEQSRVWINNGTGTFSPGQLFGFTSTADVVLADFDGDGVEDFLEVNSADDPMNLYLNLDEVFLNMRQRIDAFPAQAGAAGDFDGDGAMDVAFASGNGGPNQIWFGSSID